MACTRHLKALILLSAMVIEEMIDDFEGAEEPGLRAVVRLFNRRRESSQDMPLGDSATKQKAIKYLTGFK